MDKEIFKQFIKSYSISNHGRVRNDKTGKILKAQQRRKNQQHLSVLIQGKNYDISRLVGEKFIENPNNYPIIRHLDGNPLNNYFKNLKWGTQQENMYDAINHKTHPSLTSKKSIDSQFKNGPANTRKNRKTDLPLGVYKSSKNTFYAKLTVDKKIIYLGTFKTIEEAKNAVKIKYFTLYGVYINE